MLKDQDAVEFIFENVSNKSLGMSYFTIKIFHETTVTFDPNKDALSKEVVCLVLLWTMSYSMLLLVAIGFMLTKMIMLRCMMITTCDDLLHTILG